MQEGDTVQETRVLGAQLRDDEHLTHDEDEHSWDESAGEDGCSYSSASQSTSLPDGVNRRGLIGRLWRKLTERV